MIVLKCVNCHSARLVDVILSNRTEPPIQPCECGERTWFIADAKTSRNLGGAR